MGKKEYIFTPVEIRMIGEIKLEIARLQATLRGVLDLIHRQQGLEGPYTLDRSGTKFKAVAAKPTADKS